MHMCSIVCCSSTTIFSCFFFFNDPATTEIYTLSLHDALPIFRRMDEAVFEGDQPAQQPRGEQRFGGVARADGERGERDRKSTRLNSSHMSISYAVFCLKKKKKKKKCIH